VEKGLVSAGIDKRRFRIMRQRFGKISGVSLMAIACFVPIGLIRERLLFFVTRRNRGCRTLLDKLGDTNQGIHCIALVDFRDFLVFHLI